MSIQRLPVSASSFVADQEQYFDAKENLPDPSVAQAALNGAGSQASVSEPVASSSSDPAPSAAVSAAAPPPADPVRNPAPALAPQLIRPLISLKEGMSFALKVCCIATAMYLLAPLLPAAFGLVSPILVAIGVILLQILIVAALTQGRWVGASWESSWDSGLWALAKMGMSTSLQWGNFVYSMQGLRVLLCGNGLILGLAALVSGSLVLGARYFQCLRAPPLAMRLG